MRQFSINLEGRVKNFSLPKNRPLIPLYEAVVNSIHAINERKSVEKIFTNGKITIEILRTAQTALFKDVEFLPVEGFKIIDNGIGFNERNMQSFLVSDSTYKANIGGKGVGRFSWLKAFDSAYVDSTFKENGKLYNRKFQFSLSNPFIEDIIVECNDTSDNCTIVTLNTYRPEYASDVPKQIDKIAIRIIEHCLVYFLDPDCPQIEIKDNYDLISLNTLFQKRFRVSDNTTNFFIHDIEFNLLNVKIEERAYPGNRIYLCANNRLVESKDLEKRIIDLDNQIYDRYGFWYVGILTSPYFDNHVDMNRLSFNIPESGRDLFNEISLDEIITVACEYIKNYLNEFLNPISEEKLERIQKYVTTTAPQYRHLLKYMPDKIKAIKPKLDDDSLDDALYDIKRIFDKSNKREQKELFEKLEKPDITTEEYEQFFMKYVQKISDTNCSVLAEYVAHRRVIIELFERGLRKQDDGKFNKEKYMHNLIYPMKVTADEIDYEAHNLWLIDEKLAYCAFISSDVPFDNDYRQDRTDILILDNPIAVSDDKNDGTIFDTIIVFELKRPMRDDYNESNNPITQLYSYVRKIREGKARDKYHRPILVGDTTKYYLYAVCDITDSLMPFIENYSLTPTPDRLGYYAYNKTYNAYFESKR